MSVQIILVPSIVTKEETQLRQYSYVTYLDFASIPLWKQEMRRERRIKNSVFMWDIYFYGRLVCSLYTTCNTHLTVLFSSPLNLPIEFINLSILVTFIEVRIFICYFQLLTSSFNTFCTSGLSGSTNRKAVMFVPPYLNSSRSTVCKSCGIEDKRIPLWFHCCTTIQNTTRMFYIKWKGKNKQTYFSTRNPKWYASPIRNQARDCYTFKRL